MGRYIRKGRVYQGAASTAVREQRRRADAKRAANRRGRKYGLTGDDIETMRLRQSGRCLICAVEFHPEPRKATSGVVDHCHRTGKVRGMLCQNCNIGLGAFHEDPEKMRKAINYLMISEVYGG